MLEEITRQIEGHTICALGDAAAWPVQVRLRTLPASLLHASPSPHSPLPLLLSGIIIGAA